MTTEPVLIVEDDAALTHAVARNLEARGYKTQTVETVAGALAALREYTPALVLLDIDLPDGSGWEVLRALHSGERQAAPAIVISALRPNPRLVTELNCVGVLEKPFPMGSLLRMVQQYIGGPADHAAVE